MGTSTHREMKGQLTLFLAPQGLLGMLALAPFFGGDALRVPENVGEIRRVAVAEPRGDFGEREVGGRHQALRLVQPKAHQHLGWRKADVVREGTVQSGARDAEAFRKLRG